MYINLFIFYYLKPCTCIMHVLQKYHIAGFYRETYKCIAVQTMYIYTVEMVELYYLLIRT